MSKTRHAAFVASPTTKIKSREEHAMKLAAYTGYNPRNSAKTFGERWAELVRRAEARGVTVKPLK